MKRIINIIPFITALLAVSCASNNNEKPVAVSSVSLNETSLKLYENDTFQLEALINPGNSTNKKVTWSSSRKSYVTVSTSGLVTALNAGSSRITVTTVDGGFTAVCSVTVSEYHPVTGVTLPQSSLSMYDNETYQLSASIQPSNASNKNVNWTSSNTNVLNVSDSGLVTPVAPGEATVTVTTEEGGFTSTCTIIVNHKVLPESITLNETDVSILDSETLQLTATVNPNNVTDKSVTWSSSKTSVATVNNGLVTPVGLGETTITATTKDKGLTATCKVTVNEAPTESLKITFKTNSSDQSQALGSLDSQILSGGEILSSSSVRSVYAGKYGLKMSSRNGTGSMTLNFLESYQISKVIVNACYYTGQRGADDSSLSIGGVSKKIDTGGLTDFEYKLSSASEINSLTLDSTNRLYVNSVTIKYTNFEPVYPTSIAINGQSDIAINDEVQFSLSYQPSNTNQKKATWSSSDTSVAIVSSTGVVKGLKEGSAVIKAVCKDANDQDIEATYNVTISSVHVTSVILNKSVSELVAGQTLQLTATVSPNNATDKSLVWSSNNTAVATVSDSGLVTIKSNATAGATTVITATSNDGGYTATCSITVVEQQLDEWTIMFYVSGSNLESDGGAASEDINELLSVSNKPDNINIVYQTGGTKRWAGSVTTEGASFNASKIQRWEVGNKKLINKYTSTSNGNMAASATLEEYLKWGVTNYPAQKYGVIFWNHGGAMQGVCIDDNYSSSYNYDYLMNSEINLALKNTFNDLGLTEKFEFVGYDACLMQVQDIAEFNSEYFNYMVASEELENGDGWDYESWIDDLYAGKSTVEVLKANCDGFVTQYGSYSNDQSLSLLDLSKMSSYKTAWENLAKNLYSNVNSYGKNNFLTFLKKLKYFGTVDRDQGYEDIGTFDVKDFLNKIPNYSALYNGLSSYVSAVSTALSDLIVYNKKGSSAGESNGLAFYFDSGYYCDPGSVYSSSQTNFTEWKKIVDDFGYNA